MAFKRFAIFDGARKTSQLDVVLGGRGIQSNFSLINEENNTCLSTIFVFPLGAAGFEFLQFGDEETPVVNSIIGFSFTTNVDAAPGYSSGDSIGFNTATGELVCNSTVLATATTSGSNKLYAMVVDFDNKSVAVYHEGVSIVSAAFPFSISLLTDLRALARIGASIGGGAAGIATLWINAGQQKFENPQLRDLGWFETVEAPFNIRVAEREYMSPPDDEEPNVRYRGVVSSAGALSVSNLSFWPWARQTSGSSALRLTLLNGSGFFDAAIGGEFRDEVAELRVLNEDGTIESLGTFAFDSAEANGDEEIQLLFRDSMAELEKPGQNRFFLPNAEGNVANRAYPTTIGAAFSVPLVPYDLLNRLYAVDAIGAPRIGKVRDKGDALEPFASPADYTILGGGQAVQLRFDPEGIVTADVSVTSTDLTAGNGSPPIEILGGDGNPFNVLTWTAGGTSYGDDPFIFGGDAIFPCDGFTGFSHLQYTTSNILQAGKQYVIRFRLDRLPGGTDRTTSLSLCRQSSPFADIYTVRSGLEANFSAPPYSWENRYYEFYYSPQTTHSLFIVYQAAALIRDPEDYARISELTITEVPEIDVAQEDSEVDEEVVPVSLSAAMKQLIEDRWQLPISFWNSADAEKIDTETGYGGVGWHAQEQYVRRQALEDILTGYTAAAYMDENSQLRVTRLVAPEEVPDEEVAGELRRFLSVLKPAADEAPGLTTRLGVRKNYQILDESDLVSDFVEVPISLRRRLKQDYRFIVTSGAQLAPGYAHADLASAVGTALARIEDGQAEIDRVCSIYSRQRAFYSVEVPFEDNVQLGRVYRTFYPRYGLSGGVKLLVVGRTVDPINRTRAITLWGLSPSELLKEEV